MNVKHRSSLIPRVLVVTGFALSVAMLISTNVEEPPMAHILRLEHKLDETSNRVSMNAKQIQVLLATKYSDSANNESNE